MNAIEVDGVSKTYRIPHERHTTLVERVLSTFRPSRVETLTALNNVSLQVPTGEFVGVIGANGSGKSTLLKVMAGLLVPDLGEVRVHGRLVPLLELGLGFHQELTVRENVALYGAVLGYPPAEMERRVTEVVEFAGLERFRDAKLKSLSSGMLVRLAFATALRADADILLLDEVMAVGDAQFQRKCIDVFTDLKRQRRTIVLVSHDLHAVQRFCDKVFWLDRGKLVMAGDSTDVVQTYLTVVQTAGIQVGPIELSEESEHRWGDRRVGFVDARLEHEDGTPAVRVRAGSRVVIRLQVRCRDATSDPVFGLIVWLGGQVAYSTNTELLGFRTGSFAPGEVYDVHMSFAAALRNGQYTVTVACADRFDGSPIDWINHLFTFVVEGSHCGDGLADLGAEFACQPSSAVGREPTRAAPTG
jgi:lipopolysaccharide transport system ATP-binding protein